MVVISFIDFIMYVSVVHLNDFYSATLAIRVCVGVGRCGVLMVSTANGLWIKRTGFEP